MSNISEFTDYVSNLPSGEVQILISDPTNQRVQRKYFLPILGNESINLSAYLLSSSVGSTFTFYVKLTATNECVSGARIKAKKSINATWVTIQEEETDNSGTAIFFLDPTTIYQFEIDYQGNKTYYNTYPKNDYTFWIGDILALASKYNLISGSVHANCSFNNSNKMLKCFFIDAAGDVVKVWFKVIQGGAIRNEICSGYKETNSYTFTCNLSNVVGEVYYQLIGEKNGIRKTMISDYLELGGGTKLFSDLPPSMAISLALLLIIVMVGIGLFSPVIAIITGIAGLVISYGLGLVTVTQGTLIGIIVVGAIIIFLSRE